MTDSNQKGEVGGVFEDVVDGDIPPGKGTEFRGRAAAVARSLVLETLLAPKESTEEADANEEARIAREAKEVRRPHIVFTSRGAMLGIRIHT